MIIDFKFTNFKNFRNETDFSFEAGSKRELKEHIITFKKYKLLPVKVIYGGNSTGKTNIIEAFTILRSIIINKNIQITNKNYIVFCSNFSSKADYEAPMIFDITFKIGNKIYNYYLKLKNNYQKSSSQILSESLKLNNEIVFSRDDNNVLITKIIDENYDALKKLLNQNISNLEVFTSWYQIFDRKLCEEISNFFETNICPIIDLEKFTLPLPDKVRLGNSMYTNKKIDALLKELNVGNQRIIIKPQDNGTALEFATYKSKKDEDFEMISLASTSESKGTLKLIDLLLALEFALKNGSILLIDELDASIHHEIIYNIIQIFADKNTNPKGAQLVFTTHNPVYMTKELLRRDEIVFVEKDNNFASISTLEDYKLRNDEVYLKNYLAGKYTILPNFDLNNVLNPK